MKMKFVAKKAAVFRKKTATVQYNYKIRRNNRVCLTFMWENCVYTEHDNEIERKLMEITI